MTQCPGSGRIVPAHAWRARIFPADRRTAIAPCWHADAARAHAAPVALAEIRPDGHGYRRRYLTHDHDDLTHPTASTTEGIGA